MRTGPSGWPTRCGSVASTRIWRTPGSTFTGCGSYCPTAVKRSGATKAPRLWRLRCCWTGTWSASCRRSLARRPSTTRRSWTPSRGPTTTSRKAGNARRPRPPGSPWRRRAGCSAASWAASGKVPTKQDRSRHGGWFMIDWAGLRAAATEVAQRAYAPYSRLRVGAAGQAEDGRIVTGCNVENASFGLTLGAECGLVSALHATGGGRLAAVSVVAGDGEPLVPCGRCRQLLLEAGGPGLLLDTEAGPRELGELLPGAFTGTDLSARRD